MRDRLRSRRAKLAAVAALSAAIAVAVAVVLVAGGGGAETVRSPSLADAVPYDGRSPRQPASAEQRVLLELQRPALGRLPGVRSMPAGERRAYVASLKREAVALRGALTARGVRLTSVVAFERTWNGFAATVRTRDLAAISSLGVRAQPVRRFYPALGEPAATGGRAPARPAGASGPPVALLASGVAAGAGVVRGYDAIDRDRDASPGADPRDGRRREASGTALAGILTAGGERVRPIRVAGLRADLGGAPPEEYGTTDELLAGLERAVDADGDGDTADRAAVALVGVNAPYAGFARSPEAEAVAGAAGLGMLVVAPAGNEGPARPPNGTVGSPAAARGALAVAALAAGLPRASLAAGDVSIAGAAMLAGTPPAARLKLSAPIAADDPAALLERGAPRLTGALALVRAGGSPAAQASAAAAAGARAVVIAEPRERRTLAAMPVGRVPVPVLGVTGAAARALLGAAPGSLVRVGAARPPSPPRSPAVSAYSARGPALDGTPKPDLAAPGAAATRGAEGAAAVAGGTAVAAALATVEAARIARADPDLPPAAIRGALTAAADPGGRDGPAVTAVAAGAGTLRRPSAPAPLDGPARPLRLPRQAAARPFTVTAPVRLRAGKGASARLAATADDRRATASISPAEVEAGADLSATLTVKSAPRPAGAFATGRVAATDPAGRPALSLPFAVPAGDPPPVPVGDLRLARRGREVVGVRFTLGAFDRGDPLGAGTAFTPVERLSLELIRPGGDVVRRLTPPRGARELLPAEYAYTLQRSELRRLADGSLAFRVRARGPRQRVDSERRSAAFRRP